MIKVYLVYGQDMRLHSDDKVTVIPAGSEQLLWQYEAGDEQTAASVVASWVRDPDTISIRMEREAA